MYAVDQHIGGNDQLIAGMRRDHGSVIADPESDIVAAAGLGTKVAVNETKFVQLKRYDSLGGRNVTAKRSSTAFTNL